MTHKCAYLEHGLLPTTTRRRTHSAVGQQFVCVWHTKAESLFRSFFGLENLLIPSFLIICVWHLFIFTIHPLSVIHPNYNE